MIAESREVEPPTGRRKLDRVRIDAVAVPEWVCDDIDAEADRVGESRNALIRQILVAWADAHAQRTQPAGVK